MGALRHLSKSCTGICAIDHTMTHFLNNEANWHVGACRRNFIGCAHMANLALPVGAQPLAVCTVLKVLVREPSTQLAEGQFGRCSWASSPWPRGQASSGYCLRRRCLRLGSSLGSGCSGDSIKAVRFALSRPPSSLAPYKPL